MGAHVLCKHEVGVRSSHPPPFTSRWTSGLGHYPFKVARRVRFPYAIPYFNRKEIVCLIMTIKAELV